MSLWPAKSNPPRHKLAERSNIRSIGQFHRAGRDRIINGARSVEFFASQRVSVMYVCFGFSLARLRRARTIDMQCQSLSLRRAFLLRSVCLSLHLIVESLAVRWPTCSQNRSKITMKIDRKSIPGDTSGHPKSSENRSRDALWTPRGVQQRPEDVSGVSRERPGASLARRGSV